MDMRFLYEQKDGKIVDSSGMAPSVRYFRLMPIGRALNDINAIPVVGLDKNNRTMVFGSIAITGPDVLFPECHLHAQSVRVCCRSNCIGPVDPQITSDSIQEFRETLDDPDYPVADLPKDLKLVFLVLASFCRKLGLPSLDRNLTSIGDIVSFEFKTALENSL